MGPDFSGLIKLHKHWNQAYRLQGKIGQLPEALPQVSEFSDHKEDTVAIWERAWQLAEHRNAGPQTPAEDEKDFWTQLMGAQHFGPHAPWRQEQRNRSASRIARRLTSERSVPASPTEDVMSFLQEEHPAPTVEYQEQVRAARDRLVEERLRERKMGGLNDKASEPRRKQEGQEKPGGREDRDLRQLELSIKYIDFCLNSGSFEPWKVEEAVR